MLKARDRLNHAIAEATGQALEKVQQDTERNYWMSAEEALEYGIVGRIVVSASDL
jgi:ATP-dependent Clp protease protease subunit